MGGGEQREGEESCGNGRGESPTERGMREEKAFAFRLSWVEAGGNSKPEKVAKDGSEKPRLRKFSRADVKETGCVSEASSTPPAEFAGSTEQLS